MANIGGRKRAEPYQKLYRKGQGSSFLIGTGPNAGTWKAVWTYRDENDNQKRKAFYGRTEKIARDKMLDWKADGGEEQRDDWTVTQLFEFLLKEEEGYFQRQGRQQPDTLFDYRSQWRRHIKPRIGNMKLAKVRASHLDGVLLAAMNGDPIQGQQLPPKPISKKTTLNMRRLIGLCFAEGNRLGYLTKNRAEDIMKIEPDKYRAQIINLDQMGQLINAAEGKRIQLAIMLAGYCGLRESEIAGLMHADFDAESSTIRIAQQWKQIKGGGMQFKRPKTEAGFRKIAIPNTVAEALRAQPKESLFLFPSQTDPGRPVHPTLLYAETMALIESNGLTKIRFHDLRHSANNILKQLGVDAVTRRDILGHSTTAVTENVYTQTVHAEMIEAMDKIGVAIETEDARKLAKRS